MGKLTSFVLGLFPSLQQELIDARVTQALNREYHDEILRLRSEIARLRSTETEYHDTTAYPWQVVSPFEPLETSSTSDAWTDEPLRKSRRQQCKDLEEMYLKQIETEKTTAQDMQDFYG